VTDFDEIRRIVMDDSRLTETFTSTGSQEELFGLVIALGRERGLDVTTAQLEETVRLNRRSWLERWLVL
jgi:hypothetical protein